MVVVYRTPENGGAGRKAKDAETVERWASNVHNKSLAKGETNADNKEVLLDIEADVLTNKEILEENMALLKGMDQEILALITEEKEQEKEIVDAGGYNRIIKKALVVVDRWMKKFGDQSNSNAGKSEPKPVK